jgi:hypothetical protein
MEKKNGVIALQIGIKEWKNKNIKKEQSDFLWFVERQRR